MYQLDDSQISKLKYYEKTIERQMDFTRLKNSVEKRWSTN